MMSSFQAVMMRVFSAPKYYKKKLSDIQSLSLLEHYDDYGVLHFNKASDEAGTYTINITLICNDGTVFKASTPVEFS